VTVDMNAIASATTFYEPSIVYLLVIATNAIGSATALYPATVIAPPVITGATITLLLSDATYTALANANAAYVVLSSGKSETELANANASYTVVTRRTYTEES
jgi:hypothetical protein